MKGMSLHECPHLIAATVLTTAMPVVPVTAQANDIAITMLSSGGAYSEAQRAAFVEPWNGDDRNFAVRLVDAPSSAVALAAQVEAGAVTVDVVDLQQPDAVRACDEGLLEPIDVSAFPPAPDGTPAVDDFLLGSVGECHVRAIVFPHVFAFDTDALVGNEPRLIANFFDLDRFAGRRGMRRRGSPNLELALMADSVPASETYATLATSEGIDRASHHTIRERIVVWWEAGAQPAQLFADGEVAMTTARIGRIFDAAVGEGQPFGIV